MNRVRCTWLLLSLLSVASAGCCCVQGIPSCGNGNYAGAGCDLGGGLGAACGCGACGSAPLANLSSCRGACGEVYVDEWVSEPPSVDHCGYDCGGCGHCGQCRPVRNLLRLLWGSPYVASCSTGLCGPSCDGGCSNCGAGGVEYGTEHEAGMVMSGGGGGCNCGQNHKSGEVYHSDPSPMLDSPMLDSPMLDSPMLDSPMLDSPNYLPPSAPMNVAPQTTPTRAPNISPSSAKRLNPAKQRQAVSAAAATRR